MEIPRHWRLKAQRYCLEGSTCPLCGQHIFPPRPVCPLCTTDLAQIAGWGLLIFPASMKTADIKPRINKYEITERMIG